MICSLLHIETDRTDDGRFVAFVVEIGSDCVLHVSDSYDDRDRAAAAARAWIDRNQ